MKKYIIAVAIVAVVGIVAPHTTVSTTTVGTTEGNK